MNSLDLGMWHMWIDIEGKDFWGADGWPCDFASSKRGEELIAAICELPGAEFLDHENREAEGIARALYGEFEAGQSAKSSWNQPASGKATEVQIRRLHKLLGDLSEHLMNLKKPAVDSLKLEGFDHLKLNDMINEHQEIARFAFGLIDPLSDRGTLETKVVARTVCEGAAQVYVYVTKSKATFTTELEATHRTGPWPNFLGTVYSILGIEASVSSQVQTLSKKRNEKTER